MTFNWWNLLALLPALLCTAATSAQQPQPLPPSETIKSLRLPPGFSATLFAGEPDLCQPIGFCFDDRGRLWVAENLSYPKWSDRPGNDRIVILEDTDGDGRFDKRTVFYDKLNYLTGLEVGFGGVFVVSAPNLLFIPDKDGDDRPDAPPQVLLDGFGHQGVHNLVNGCTWGPDGWLYGGHGGSSSGKIGALGAPDDQRVFFDGGVWRYHPQTRRFEPILEGTTNPWGVDFDDHGQAFIPNSVTPHLYHVIPGSHVERRRQSPNSRYAYAVIDTIADHKHWAGGKWEDSRPGKTVDQNLLGGGHAHSGIMCYLGDNWPDRYRNTLFLNNIHGDRMNNDLPRRSGSGFVATHGTDFLTCADPWYMALHIRYGPDGAVYLSDWYDTGECHTRNPHTANGRIYKITYGTPKPFPAFDLSKLDSAALVELQLHKNDWWVRRARRLLQERGPEQDVHARLRTILSPPTHAGTEHGSLRGPSGGPDSVTTPQRLRALWALHVTKGASEQLLHTLLSDPDEYLRAWAIQLLAEDRHPTDPTVVRFEQLATSDPSPLVRLYLASAATRLPFDKRWTLLAHLAAHAEDATDQNLPFMYWYALEPLVPTDPRRALALAMNPKIPKLREFVTRRMVEHVR